MLAIFKKELSSYFNSTLGYIVLALYLLFSGFFFWLICFQGSTNALVNVINYMLYVVFFLVPLITMKSFAEEKRQHTDQALLTAPISLWEIVFGKYLSALALYVMCNMVFIFYALVLMAVLGATIAWGQLLGALFGIILLGAALLSMNLLFSSLTEHQIIAAVVGIAAGLVIMLYDSIVAAVENFINTLFGTSFDAVFLDNISITGHYENFISGVLSPVDFVFFLSFIALFLFLTNRVLDRKRWA
ncbi:MAG: ABC transporter permease subunit [Clostridia bacterium]|nr:ABC transporter permease subunit [Clostridia bacterium]